MSMKKVLICLIMATTMLHWPNMIFHYSSFTAMYLKNALVLISIAVFAFLGYRKLRNFTAYFAIMFTVSIIYCVINGFYIHSYMIRAIFFVSICATFYRYPTLMITYIKIGLIISALLGLQAFVLSIFALLNLPIGYDIVNFIGSDPSSKFNFLAGFSNDYGYFRTRSYFTETNRLAYFLTPALFISYYYAKTSLLAKSGFGIILFGILSTFSVFSFFAIGVGVFTYMIYGNTKAWKFILMATICVLIGMTIYSLNAEYFDFMFDKTGSASNRITGILAKIEMVRSNVFGYSEVDLAKNGDAGLSTLTLLQWAIIGGLQVVLSLIHI